MLRFYDRNKNRLVYLAKAASSEFWDEQWAALKVTKKIENKSNPLITGITRKYLLEEVASWKEVAAEESMFICWKNLVFQLQALILPKKL